ncbi:MAG: hypothetical protein JXN60_02565, partial [Lentisphaerae bacterium]|nr:hypothetical protein [Lentisphaerota bacterium]
ITSQDTPPHRFTPSQTFAVFSRRRLRCFRIKQCRRPKTIEAFLTDLGVSGLSARKLSASKDGWWRISATPPTQVAMTKAWFSEQGLVSVTERYIALQTSGNRRGTDPYARWCERREP